MRVNPVDLDRLTVILRHPESIVALEAFNELIYRPSDSMLESLINLFIHTIQHQQQDLNPLFILLLLKRLILHSLPTAPLQPSKLNLATSFSRLFLPTFINLRSIVSSSHLPLLDRLDQQLIICLSHLSTRLVHLNPSNPQLNLDPLVLLITPIQQALLTSIDHHLHHLSSSIHSILGPLKIIKNIIRSLYASNSIRESSILQKITHTHFENLYSIYNRLILLSNPPSSNQSTRDSNLPISSGDHQFLHQCLSSLLKIFKMMVEPLVELTSSHRDWSQEGNHDQYGLLDQVLQKLLFDFQTSLHSQLQIIDHNSLSNLDHAMAHTPEVMKVDGFSSHLIQYGEIILGFQASRPSIITHEVLKVYLQILEFVSTQIVFHHHSLASNQESLIGTALDRRLLKFHPLLIQALRLLNNALNPWASYDPQPDHQNSLDNTPSVGQTCNDCLVKTLTADDASKLFSIVQPLLSVNFESEGYLDGRPIRDDHSSDEEALDEDEDEDSDDPETVEEIVEDDHDPLRPPAEHHQYQEDDHHHQELISKDDDLCERYYSEEEHDHHLTDLQHPNYRNLDHYRVDDDLMIIKQKEPLRVEIEELIASLQFKIDHHPSNL